MAVNPVVLEIIRGSLSSTIKEMELLMERCAMSPFIKEKKDYFVGIFDTQGRLVCCHISQSGPGMITPIIEAYALEVSSPGPDRPLAKPEHFRRYIGRRVRVRTREAIDGSKSFSGELVEAADDAVSVAADAGIVRIPFADIHKSNLLEG